MMNPRNTLAYCIQSAQRDLEQALTYQEAAYARLGREALAVARGEQWALGAETLASVEREETRVAAARAKLTSALAEMDAYIAAHPSDVKRLA